MNRKEEATYEIRNKLSFAASNCEYASVYIKDDETDFVHHVSTYVLHYINDAISFVNKGDMETAKSRTLFVYRNALTQHNDYPIHKDKDIIKRLVANLEEAIKLFEECF